MSNLEGLGVLFLIATSVGVLCGAIKVVVTLLNVLDDIKWLNIRLERLFDYVSRLERTLAKQKDANERPIRKTVR